MIWIDWDSKEPSSETKAARSSWRSESETKTLIIPVRIQVWPTICISSRTHAFSSHKLSSSLNRWANSQQCKACRQLQSQIQTQCRQIRSRSSSIRLLLRWCRCRCLKLCRHKTQKLPRNFWLRFRVTQHPQKFSSSSRTSSSHSSRVKLQSSHHSSSNLKFRYHKLYHPISLSRSTTVSLHFISTLKPLV